MAKSTLREIIAVIGMVVIIVIGIFISTLTEMFMIPIFLTILVSAIFSRIVLRKNIAEKIKKNNSVTLTEEEYVRFCKIAKKNDKFAK